MEITNMLSFDMIFFIFVLTFCTKESLALNKPKLIIFSLYSLLSTIQIYARELKQNDNIYTIITISIRYCHKTR